ncbi:MAG TPA: hypothetical protein VMN39_04515 [Longimicrobiaceae bacterium]|nr:hypothetical protein [Longimicrobiaceae bacterium]
MDLRIFGELYAAIALLHELSSLEVDWRDHRERLCSGRSFHRRRYAARRAMLIVAGRMATLRDRGVLDAAPGCSIPSGPEGVVPIFMEEPVGRLEARLLGLLAISWGASAELVERQMERAVAGTAIAKSDLVGMDHVADPEGMHEAWIGEDQVTRRRRRIRVDRRQGRAARARRGIPRGRAA